MSSRENFAIGIKHLKLKLNESTTKNDIDYYTEQLKYMKAMFLLSLLSSGIKYDELSDEEKALLD